MERNYVVTSLEHLRFLDPVARKTTFSGKTGIAVCYFPPVCPSIYPFGAESLHPFYMFLTLATFPASLFTVVAIRRTKKIPCAKIFRPPVKLCARTTFERNVGRSWFCNFLSTTEAKSSGKVSINSQSLQKRCGRMFERGTLVLSKFSLICRSGS